VRLAASFERAAIAVALAPWPAAIAPASTPIRRRAAVYGRIIYSWHLALIEGVRFGSRWRRRL
jgi:hypothetical protein